MDDFHCEWCGGPLDPRFELAEFGDCETCDRRFDDQFITAFELGEGEHYTLEASGAVASWIGDTTLAAAALWRLACQETRKRGTFEQESLASLADVTRGILFSFHGPVEAPFGKPDAWWSQMCPACVVGAWPLAEALTTPCLRCGARSARDWQTYACVRPRLESFWDVGASAMVVGCQERDVTLVVYRLCPSCHEAVAASDDESALDTAIEQIFHGTPSAH